ncbi:hypothetical protein [Pseudolactococcus yaeyamensis]
MKSEVQTIKVWNVPTIDLTLFDEEAAKHGMNRSAYLRYLIHHIATLPIILDQTYRYEKLVEGVVAHLDLNTQMIAQAIEEGALPEWNEN